VSKSEAYKLMTDALERKTVVPKFRYSFSSDDMSTNMCVEEVTITFPDLAERMHQNAANIYRLLEDMLEDMFEEFTHEIKESNETTKQLGDVEEILNQNMSIKQAIEKLSEHRDSFPLLENQFNAVKEIAELIDATQGIIYNLSYSQSVITDATNTDKTQSLFLSLKEDIGSLCKIIDAIPDLLEAEPSIKYSYFPLENKTNLNAIKTLSKDMHSIHNNLSTACQRTQEKIDDYYWSKHPRLKRDNDGHGYSAGLS
jgi:hypothetical protein